MAGFKRGSKNMPRSFMEQRLDLGVADMRLLGALIRTLSKCKRRSVGHAVKEGLAASKEAMSSGWAEKSGVFKRAGVGLGLTKDSKEGKTRPSSAWAASRKQGGKTLGACRQGDGEIEKGLEGSFGESRKHSANPHAQRRPPPAKASQEIGQGGGTDARR